MSRDDELVSILCRFPRGLVERIDATRAATMSRNAWMREAVEAALSVPTSTGDGEQDVTTGTGRQSRGRVVVEPSPAASPRPRPRHAVGCACPVCKPAEGGG